MAQIRRSIAAALAFVALFVGVTVLASPSPASAATGGCHGAECNGQNPTGRCDSDAQTVAAMAVTDGMLELRYSPSCEANWGRYTPYKRTAYGLAASNVGIHARVTVWNPEEPSYGVARHAAGIYDSTWSEMTDGTKPACTGVELVYFFADGPRADSGGLSWETAESYESIGWTWGPCY